ncbi:hypothetical protein PV11_00902 [Exophiala sideris]|uniref:Uncharacterized protein n=1 Tax=Exophiala sideris TaxID=1016849 RepID=A0A0D1YQZ9_9EURO|nr:hypothetical protein PV11_00902 [Exophiala sideris]
MSELDFNQLAAYQPAAPTESETANAPGKATKKALANDKRNTKHKVFRGKERGVEDEIFELVGVTKEPAATGPNNETRLYRQRQAVLSEIHNLRNQVQILVLQMEAINIQKQNVKSQVTALLAEMEMLRSQLAARDNHLNGLANYIVHLELENNNLKDQIQAHAQSDGSMDNDRF